VKKNAFVPSLDRLEGRLAMSGGIQFINGLPVLTPLALRETFSDIKSAFTTFATKGENYNLLGANLTKAIRRIPFNVRDGLQATVQGEPAALMSNIASGTPLAVISATQTTQGDVTAFVQSEVQGGIFLYK
jgi:hypothetical protein